MRALIAVCLTATIVSGAHAAAQTTDGAAAQAPEGEAVPTLHAYADLVQVPTLVLSRITFKPVNWVDQRKFSVSFDGGPKFHVTHARIEGDDPLSLVILLDANRASPKVADQAIASLAPLSLHANDSVTIYGMDCQVMQAPEGGPTDAATLKHSVDLLLAHEDALTHAGDNAKCQNPANLMDTLGVLVQALSAKPGRRVILAITDGIDRGSQTSWDDVRHFAQSRSVTIFGLMSPQVLGSASDATRMQQPFNAVCQSSGGVVLLASGFDLAKELAWALTLTRSRYILEFPRPMSTADGLHNIQVSVAEDDMFIRPAGASFPTLKPLASSGPDIIASDPALRPQLGKHKPAIPTPVSDSTNSASVQPPPTAPSSDSKLPAIASAPASAEAPIVPPSAAPAPTAPPETANLNTVPVQIASAALPPRLSATPGSTTLKVSTRLTIENVTVTDSKGRPVHGLTQADFTVKEDGKPQPIKNFEEFGAQQSTAPNAAALQLEATDSTPRPATSTSAPLNIFLFDQVTSGVARGLRSSPDGITNAKREVATFLKAMPNGTRVAILELGSSL